jgi:hypothetical protein
MLENNKSSLKCSFNISMKNITNYYNSKKGKQDKVIPVHKKKAYGEHAGVAPLILNLGTRGRSVVVTSQLLYPHKRSLVPIK